MYVYRHETNPKQSWLNISSSYNFTEVKSNSFSTQYSRVEWFNTFSIFENLYISVDQVYFYELNSKKLATWAKSDAIY